MSKICNCKDRENDVWTMYYEKYVLGEICIRRNMPNDY